jgi:release factor glutamine methyltransferase
MTAVNDHYQQLRSRLEAELKFLPDKPEEAPDSTLHALWFAAAGIPVSAETALQRTLPELNVEAATRLQELVAKRIGGTPLAHLTQRQHFVDLEMLAGPDALVPRKETELLARAAIRIAKQIADRQNALTVMDVCTGSGNVALAIAHHVPQAHVFAADLSKEAVALAKRNAVHLQLTDRSEFRDGDLLGPFDQPEFMSKVDLLTCNPPYISSAKVEQMHTEISAHEPHLAFDGGPFGVAILMRLLQDAPKFLRDGGWLVFEVGLGQGPAMTKRLEKSGSFHEVKVIHDAHNAIRAIAARFRALNK